mmetsp:Transcript_28927/g.86069  ORF Transcript_28927/g.86069 Transcript_28927/m.86069 type:complete len:220 (+) Transcript_28927:831-1490(+)
MPWKSLCLSTAGSAPPRSSSHCPRRSRSRPRSIFSTAMMFCVRPRRTGPKLSRSCLSWEPPSSCGAAPWPPSAGVGAGEDGGATLPERGDASTGVRQGGDPGPACWLMASSCRRSLANCDMRDETLALCAAATAPPPWATPLRSTIWKLPRPGEVSLDDGMLSLSDMEGAHPGCAGIQGVEHSPSADLSSSLPSSSLFCSSSAPVSPAGWSSALPSLAF